MNFISELNTLPESIKIFNYCLKEIHIQIMKINLILSMKDSKINITWIDWMSPKTSKTKPASIYQNHISIVFHCILSCLFQLVIILITDFKSKICNWLRTEVIYQPKQTIYHSSIKSRYEFEYYKANQNLTSQTKIFMLLMGNLSTSKNTIFSYLFKIQ